jgi:hypothetical protein
MFLLQSYLYGRAGPTSSYASCTTYASHASDASSIASHASGRPYNFGAVVGTLALDASLRRLPHATCAAPGLSKRTSHGSGCTALPHVFIWRSTTVHASARVPAWPSGRHACACLSVSISPWPRIVGATGPFESRGWWRWPTTAPPGSGASQS